MKSQNGAITIKLESTFNAVRDEFITIALWVEPLQKESLLQKPCDSVVVWEI